jgi:hypothetical protein
MECRGHEKQASAQRVEKEPTHDQTQHDLNKTNDHDETPAALCLRLRQPS